MNNNRTSRRIGRTVLAFVIGCAAHAANAQSFAPWDARGVAPSAATATSAAVVSSGFAPWHMHTTLHEMGDGAARMGDASGSVFRPWS